MHTVSFQTDWCLPMQEEYEYLYLVVTKQFYFPGRDRGFLPPPPQFSCSVALWQQPIPSKIRKAIKCEAKQYSLPYLVYLSQINDFSFFLNIDFSFQQDCSLHFHPFLWVFMRKLLPYIHIFITVFQKYTPHLAHEPRP